MLSDASGGLWSAGAAPAGGVRSNSPASLPLHSQVLASHAA